MTPRLKELLERRKAKTDTATATQTEDTQVVSLEETPAVILVPAFDCPLEDEFSQWF